MPKMSFKSKCQAFIVSREDGVNVEHRERNGNQFFFALLSSCDAFRTQRMELFHINYTSHLVSYPYLRGKEKESE